MQTALLDPSTLLKAYVIHGRKENSFFPLQIYIGDKGLFLTPEVVYKLEKEDALPVGQRTGGTNEFTSIGKGGGYLTQYFKVKDDSNLAKTPVSVVAFITVVQPHGQEFDVQIAARGDLDLEPISGGEAYYNTFGPFSSDQKAEPHLDRSKILPALSQLAVDEWLAEVSASGVEPTLPHVQPKQVAPESTLDSPVRSESTKPPAKVAESAAPTVEQRAPLWAWAVGILTLLALVLLVVKRRELH